VLADAHACTDDCAASMRVLRRLMRLADDGAGGDGDAGASWTLAPMTAMDERLRRERRASSWAARRTRGGLIVFNDAWSRRGRVEEAGLRQVRCRRFERGGCGGCVFGKEQVSCGGVGVELTRGFQSARGHAAVCRRVLR